MELIAKQLKSEIDFIVKTEDTGSNGALHICRILRELTDMHDHFVISTFGDLGIYKHLNTTYRLDMTGKAKKGDEIRIEAKAAVSRGYSVDITITVYNTRRKNVIARGRFVFELQNAGKERTTLVTDHLMAI